MNSTALNVCYLIAAIGFILALKGLSSPATARRGNLVGAAGMLIAVGATLIIVRPGHLLLILASIAVGTAIAFPTARRVPMTAIPQLVAIFNGVGGAAAALVSILEALRTHNPSVASAIAIAASALIGAVSLTGSLLTFVKLQELITGRPITYAGQRIVVGLLVIGSVGGAAWYVSSGTLAGLWLMVASSLALGIAIVLPVGGADVPVVISLLNAFTGLAVAASGVVLHNVLLLIAGTLVGASGALLTRMMSKAMGRSLPHIIFGAFSAPVASGGAAVADDRPVRVGSIDDVAIQLAYARSVVVVPGYGLAVAQGQHACQELVELLEERGVSAWYAIHPVAGRMPGHMNVLLAEANVPYEQLHEMDDANNEFARTDVVLVVGANDVVNPAARTSAGSPIYGMPILNVDEAGQVVFLKRSMRPGFAGIDNELLHSERTQLLFGDAKDTLTQLVGAVARV